MPESLLERFRAYPLPVQLVPVDAVAIVLLIDLNLKSKAGVTLGDFGLKLEAIAFTTLFAFALFATVLQAIVADSRKGRGRKE